MYCFGVAFQHLGRLASLLQISECTCFTLCLTSLKIRYVYLAIGSLPNHLAAFLASTPSKYLQICSKKV